MLRHVNRNFILSTLCFIYYKTASGRWYNLWWFPNNFYHRTPFLIECTWNILLKMVLGNAMSAPNLFFSLCKLVVVSSLSLFEHWSLILLLCLGQFPRIDVILMLMVSSWNTTCETWTDNEVNYPSVFTANDSCILEKLATMSIKLL